MSDKENDPPQPSPEEISKKLSEFFKQNFGDSVGFGSFNDANTLDEEPEIPEEPEQKDATVTTRKWSSVHVLATDTCPRQGADARVS